MNGDESSGHAAGWQVGADARRAARAGGRRRHRERPRARGLPMVARCACANASVRSRPSCRWRRRCRVDLALGGGATMSLDDFARHPLLFGPSPVHKLDAAHPPPRRGGGLGQARRLQQRARVRRQQDPQARVPRRRRARPGLRHARLDRRRAVQPHAPGRGRRGGVRAEVRARAGALGGVARRRLRPRRQHRAEPDHGRRRAAGPERVQHRLPGQLEAGARRRRGGRRQAVRDPGRRIGPPARRARLRGLGGRGRSARRPSSASSSTRSSSAPSPARRRPG